MQIFADAAPDSILGWVQLFREFGGLAILGYLVYEARPLLKMFLDYQGQQAEADRQSRHAIANMSQVSIAEAYKTMREEGEKNRNEHEGHVTRLEDAVNHGFERVVDAVNGSCQFNPENHRHQKPQPATA